VKGIELVEVGWGSAIIVILFSLDDVRVKSIPQPARDHDARQDL
jgi:hypothetical protein